MKFFLADVNHRRCSLLRASILGVLSAFFIYYFFFGLKHDILRSSITILFLGLPTFYVLWRFRTHDVQKQIDKTEEGTNNSTFFECARMLAEGKTAEERLEEKKSVQYNYESLSKKTALEQLAYLRRETGFDKKRIDSLTRGLHLSGEIFEFARFNGLDLSMADLNQTKLAYADLTGTILSYANLTGAYLNGAKLANANLSRVKLIGAELNRTKLNIVTNLSGADLTGAKLNGADLSGANLSRANLREAKLNRAKFDRTELDRDGLRGAKLRGAKLRETESDKVELRGADLRGANLSGANLSRADLDDANLTGAIYDSKTKFIGTILESQEMRDKAGMEYRENEPV